MEKEIKISRFMSEVCDILDISKPRIEYKPQEFFPTSTMLAMLDTKKNLVYVRDSEDITFDMLFSITHELRHCWQMKNKPEMLNEYRESQNLTVEEYNLQPAEIDANAFAGAIMVDFFGIKPLFHGLSDKVKDMIYAEMNMILKTILE